MFDLKVLAITSRFKDSLRCLGHCVCQPISVPSRGESHAVKHLSSDSVQEMEAASNEVHYQTSSYPNLVILCSFLFHENVTHLLVCQSSSFHLPCIHLASGWLHLLILHISPSAFLLNWMVPVLTCCLLSYSFYNSPCYSLSPTSNSTTDATIFYCAQGLTAFISRILPFLYLPI